MKRETLEEIRKELKPFVKVVHTTSSAFNSSPIYITLEVIVHNICHDPKGTVDYNHEEDVKRVNNYVLLLKEMRYYFKQDHILQWIASEVLMTIEAYDMMEVDTSNEDLDAFMRLNIFKDGNHEEE